MNELDRPRLEELVKYISRPPVANHRLTRRSDGVYTYKLKTPWRSGVTHIAASEAMIGNRRSRNIFDQLFEPPTISPDEMRFSRRNNCGEFFDKFRQGAQQVCRAVTPGGFQL